MKKTIIRLLYICLLFFSSCRSQPLIIEGDIILATANLFAGNGESKFVVTQSLLEQNADILVLHEAGEWNVDFGLLEEAGYSVYGFDSTSRAFQAVIASRIPCEEDQLSVEYPTMSIDPFIVPLASCHLSVDGHEVAILGVHIPPPIFFSGEVREHGFNLLDDMVDSGRIVGGPEFPHGDEIVILAGDFNTFPSDRLFKKISGSGLSDTFMANNNRYDFTWGPEGFSPMARIDYIYVSEEVETVFQTSFEIPGSDHRGVIAGVNIR
ncbi:MAG: endonuclease/exonuclease/phosphatase family protein [Spirochaetales bacterium]|nr:endonuclease/exonuclease/phosphatase family protein [Spirochaetales bacterium]